MMATMEDVKAKGVVARDRGMPSLMQPAFLFLQRQAHVPTTCLEMTGAPTQKAEGSEGRIRG